MKDEGKTKGRRKREGKRRVNMNEEEDDED